MRYSDVRWRRLGDIGSRWRLLSFGKSDPPLWDAYFAEQRAYWGADEADKNRFQYYFGAIDAESAFLEKARASYIGYKRHLQQWHGLCEVGDEVDVIDQGKNVVVLSLAWSGSVRDHSDLEMWLKRKFRCLVWPMGFCCEIYSFGTRTVLPGSIEAQMGEPPGAHRVSHRVGSTRDKNEPVSFSDNAGVRRISIGDATFEIVS